MVIGSTQGCGKPRRRASHHRNTNFDWAITRCMAILQAASTAGSVEWEKSTPTTSICAATFSQPDAKCSWFTFWAIRSRISVSGLPVSGGQRGCPQDRMDGWMGGWLRQQQRVDAPCHANKQKQQQAVWARRFYRPLTQTDPQVFVGKLQESPFGEGKPMKLKQCLSCPFLPFPRRRPEKQYYPQRATAYSDILDK